jgi:hypothetical protein
MELLYSLPAIGSTQTGSAATLLNSAATSPMIQLPALQNIWSSSQLPGKGFLIVAAGGYDIAAANTLTTMRVSFDTTAGVTALNTIATTGALAGGCFGAAVATGSWEAQLWITCAGISGNTGSTWYSQGQLQFNSVSSTGTGVSFAWGNTITAGIPQSISLGLTNPYYVDLVAQWQANPTAMVCSQFMVFGLN